MTRLSIIKFAATLCAAVLAIASTTFTAQAQSTSIQAVANIPFAFELGSHHFEAGRYTIRRSGDHAIIINGSSDSALTMTMLEMKNNPASGAKIVFHRYGNRYFLRQVWTDATGDYYISCIDTRAEKKAQREIRSQNSASAAESTTVELALLARPN